MTQPKHSDSISRIRIELMLYVAMLFLASKQLQDWIMNERAYGNGRLLFPIMFSVFLSFCYFKIKKLYQSNIQLVLISLLMAWLSSSIAMLIDSMINLDFKHLVTSGWPNMFQLAMSVLFGPWIILTPIIGALVTLLFAKLRV